MSDDKHQKAMKGLAVLVRQAKAGKTISHTDWGKEIGVHWRHTGPVLDKMGRALKNLSESDKWSHPRIPALGVIVVHKGKKLPALSSVSFFLPEADRSKEGMQREQKRVFGYKHWDAVLTAFGMQPEPSSTNGGSTPSGGGRGGDGEGPEHEKLKMDVAKNPGKYGFKGFRPGKTEQPLRSGDILDVLFETNKEVVGVEVKSRISDDADIERGVYQCIKYQAVLEAQQRARKTASPKRVSTVLLVGRKVSSKLRALAEKLGVQVREFPDD